MDFLGDEITRKFRPIAQKFIPDDEFNKELRGIMNMQLKHFIKSPDMDGFIPEIYVVGVHDKDTGNRKRALFMIAADGFNDDKYGMIREAGRQFALNDKSYPPVMLFMLSEAWIASYDKSEETAIKDGTHIRPSERNDRKEVLVVAGLTIDGRGNMAVAEMVRNKDKKLSGLINTRYEEYNGETVSMEANLLLEFLKGYAIGSNEKNKKA